MIKADLITGFLGSGKTTFLKKYAEYLVKSGEKVGILENDYGAVNVDMMLLNELENMGCQVETVAGACDFDCHKRRFKTKLIAMGMSGLTRVIIEPSGIFNTDEFFDVLREDPLENWYEIGSVIAVADPTSTSESSEQSEYLLASQIAQAGVVVFSKSQLVADETIAQKIALINSALSRFKCARQLSDDVITKAWDNLDDKDFEAVKNSGYRLESTVSLPYFDSAYSTLYYMNTGFDLEQAESAARKILADKNCGNVLRIKGFVKSGAWYELNATAFGVETKPIENGQDIIIVIGENLSEESVNTYFTGGNNEA